MHVFEWKKWRKKGDVRNWIVVGGRRRRRGAAPDLQKGLGNKVRRSFRPTSPPLRNQFPF